MKPAITAAVALVALALPAAAEAAGTPCGTLADGRWRATDIRATHLSCRSARVKLRRWLPPPLPSNPVGWNCFPYRGRRMCAVGQGDAPRFTFRLRRVRAPAAASADTCRPVHNLPELDGSRYEGTDIFRIRTVGVGCRRARRVAHRATIKGFRLGAAVPSYRWRRWRVERDLRGDVDRYAARAGAARVSWRVGLFTRASATAADLGAAATRIAAAPASAHPELHRACRQRVTYYIGVGHVTCRFAVRAVARMKRGGPKPRGWRCTDNRATRRHWGTCRSGGRIFHWIDGE
jgi:hypothetical protein